MARSTVSEKKSSISALKRLDGDSILLSKDEIARKAADLKAEKQKSETSSKIIQDFSRRMVPAMQKSTALSRWQFYHIVKQIMLWANEYIEAYGSRDNPNARREFVNEKLDFIRKSGDLEPPADD